MKVIAVNGSHRPKSNTYQALEIVCKALEEQGIETEILQIGPKAIMGCTGCLGCRKNADKTCVHTDDPVNEHAAKIADADGVIFGSPVYYAGVAGDMKSYMDRLFYSASSKFTRKVTTGLVAVRRSGGVVAADQLLRYFHLSGMVIAPSCYWNVIHGEQAGDIHEDIEGVDILRAVGQNMAWMLKMIDESKVAPPTLAPRTKTNFVR